jgi:hypothetical protein
VTNTNPKPHRDTYAIVGELILISNALDYLLADVLIEALHLTRSTMLMPVIMTLDPARKIEILKRRMKHIAQTDWRKRFVSFVDKAECVYRFRNIACHTQPILVAGNWTLQPFAAAKVLKDINVENHSIKPTTLDELKAAISAAEAALGSGVNLLENLKRLNAEKTRRTTELEVAPPLS